MTWLAEFHDFRPLSCVMGVWFEEDEVYAPSFGVIVGGGTGAVVKDPPKSSPPSKVSDVLWDAVLRAGFVEIEGRLRNEATGNDLT
jgi:hypothetical protein